MDRTASNQPRPVGKRYTISVAVIRLVILVAFLDLFMQFPVIAPYARTLGATGTMVGIIVAAYSGTNLVGNLLAGVVLDKWGRKIPLAVGLLVTSMALVGYALAGTTQQLLVVRAIHGLTAAILTPGAFAILGDSSQSGQRAHVMGISGAFIAVAAVIGPFISGVIRDKQGPEAVFLLSAALILATFFAFLYAIRKLKWVNDDASGTNLFEDKALSLRMPRLVTGYLAALALTIGLGVLVTHLPTVLTERGYSATRIGFSFTAFAVVAMAAMASPLSRVSDRSGRLIPIIMGLAGISAGMIIHSTSRGFAGAITGMAIFGLGFGILFPAITALISESVQWHRRGKAFGVFYAVFSLGVIIGSLLSGTLMDQPGESTTLPYLVSALVALAMLPTISLVWRLQKE